LRPNISAPVHCSRSTEQVYRAASRSVARPEFGEVARASLRSYCPAAATDGRVSSRSNPKAGLVGEKCIPGRRPRPRWGARPRETPAAHQSRTDTALAFALGLYSQAPASFFGTAFFARVSFFRTGGLRSDNGSDRLRFGRRHRAAGRGSCTQGRWCPLCTEALLIAETSQLTNHSFAEWCRGIAALRKERMGANEIARGVGCKRGNVCTALKAAGLN
jgi:hypothetical protein